MRLKRLELQGFKSFLDRTILTFEPGITGVVGPNGCGKSNIVDAILWVMGEQSAKHLRGETMSDVIFNGTDTKAPTSMAEVSLILDKEGASLPLSMMAVDRGDEVAITRRLFRDGTSEYFINKTACRLKDIHELFMDTGVGRRAYSIIEQGQIDRMVNVKPESRREIFEEVAGITKYRAKRKEAERKLELTGQNLARLQDIINELEKRMRSLKLQATRARKYKDIKFELETVDLFILGRALFKIKEMLVSLEEERTKLVEQRSESDAQYGSADAELVDLEVRRIDQEKGIETLDGCERELVLSIQRLENQLVLFEEQKKHLAESRGTLDREFSEIEEELQSLVGDKETYLRDKDELAVELETLQNHITEKTSRLENNQQQRTLGTRQLVEIQKKGSELTEEEITLKNQKAHGEQRLHESQEKRETLNKKLTDIIVELDAKKEAVVVVEGKIGDCALRSEQIETEVETIYSERQSISEQLSHQEELLFQKREAFHAKSSRLDSLRELQENLEGYSPTAREILLKLEGSSIQATPLAEVLYPEEVVEGHLEHLLGEAMNTLLVTSSEEARQLAERVHEKDLERVGVIAMDDLEEKAARVPDDTEAVTALISKVKVEPVYERVTRWWLQNVYLCQDLEALFSLRERYPECTFITQDAKVIAHGDKRLTCGVLPTKTGIFERRREIEELVGVCTALDQEVQSCAQAREDLLQQLQSQEKLHTELKEKLAAIHVESMEHRKEKEKVQIELNRADADYSELLKDSEKNQTELDETRERIDDWAGRMQEVAQQREKVVNALRTTEEEMTQLETDVEEMATNLSDHKADRSKLAERLNSVSEQYARVVGEVEHYEERREMLARRQTEEDRQRQLIEENQQSVTEEKDRGIQNRNEILVQLSDLKDLHNQTAHRITLLREQKDELTKKREEILGKIQEVELQLTEQRSNYQYQSNISIERYHREAEALGADAKIDIEPLSLLKSKIKIDWHELSREERESLLDDHLQDLRKKVERYGEVNLTAITEFEEVDERHKFLIEQKEDLDKSISILEAAIKKIDDTTKVRFKETVEGVNEKFREVFPILFGGGKAELTMTNPTNILETGIDIMAQPPGKRLQSISLLSGGEKALTATSLILAIFARKPSPFCLLDEVDAPLDDANVSRFNTVVQHMAKKSQFIVITHNRRTMEMADALYGVTMQEAGTSKMTSVQLQ